MVNSSTLLSVSLELCSEITLFIWLSYLLSLYRTSQYFLLELDEVLLEEMWHSCSKLSKQKEIPKPFRQRNGVFIPFRNFLSLTPMWLLN